MDTAVCIAFVLAVGAVALVVLHANLQITRGRSDRLDLLLVAAFGLIALVGLVLVVAVGRAVR